jgi:hypothetical protein
MLTFLPSRKTAKPFSPSRVRCAAPNPGAPLTAPGGSAKFLRYSLRSCPQCLTAELAGKLSLFSRSSVRTLLRLADLSGPGRFSIDYWIVARLRR